MGIYSQYKKAIARKGGRGYTIVPNALLTGNLPFNLRNGPLKFKHRIVLVALMSADFRGGWFKAGMNQLKNVTGFGRTIVSMVVKDLEEARLLKVSRMPNCVNEYDLSPFYDKYVTFVEDGSDPLVEPPTNTEHRAPVDRPWRDKPEGP